MKEINFDLLIGTKANLYYLNDLNRFQLGSVVFEVVEDESDGYRSMLDKVQIVQENAPTVHKLAEVTVMDGRLTKSYDFRGYSLVDADGKHTWLTFGTANYDDYYPYFVFRFNPKPTEEEKEHSELGDLLDKISR